MLGNRALCPRKGIRTDTKIYWETLFGVSQNIRSEQSPSPILLFSLCLLMIIISQELC